MNKIVRVVMAKLGLDIHWRGAVTVSRFLSDAGMEVIYIGNAFPKQIVKAAIEESADVVGLSTLCGNHLALAPQVVDLLREHGMGHIKVFLGGVIPARDIPKLKSSGIVEVFGPDTPMKEIINRILASVPIDQIGK